MTMEAPTCARCPRALYAVDSVASGICQKCRPLVSEPVAELLATEPAPPAAAPPAVAPYARFMREGPLPGSLWLMSNRIYRVVTMAIDEATRELRVVYADSDGVCFVLPVASFTNGRFTRVGG